MLLTDCPVANSGKSCQPFVYNVRTNSCNFSKVHCAYIVTTLYLFRQLLTQGELALMLEVTPYIHGAIFQLMWVNSMAHLMESQAQEESGITVHAPPVNEK